MSALITSLDRSRALALIPQSKASKMTRAVQIIDAPARTDSLAELLEMLTYKRPGHSATEALFIAKYIDSLGAHSDAYGNRWLTVGDDNPAILWTAHTDTVHHDQGRQRVVIENGYAVIPRKQKPKSNCLGADCAAGVWLMREMILAGVPGLYGFFRDEESGCGGSKWVADDRPELLDGIKFAVALDRKGYDSIITEQMGAPTASNAFAASLASALTNAGLPGFKADPTGAFTDTESFARIVSECTNLSVGYFSQHGPTEKLDLQFITRLRDALCIADFSGLVESRDAKAASLYDDWIMDSPWKREGNAAPYAYNPEPATILEFVKRYPAIVADMLESEGYTLKALEEYDEWTRWAPLPGDRIS